MDGIALDPIKQDLYIPVVNNDPWVIRPEIISKEARTNFPKKLKKILLIILINVLVVTAKELNAVNKAYKDANFQYIPGLVGFNLFPELNYKMIKFDKI